MSEAPTSNLITLQSARELIGSGSIDGKRLPLIAFMEAQQAQIERLTRELTACQTYDYRQIIEESDRLRAALERIEQQKAPHGTMTIREASDLARTTLAHEPHQHIYDVRNPGVCESSEHETGAPQT